MKELKKEKIKTWLLKKKIEVTADPALGKHIPFHDLCSRHVFPTEHLKDMYIEKCKFFANAEKHIKKLLSELKSKNIFARQLRVDASHFIEQLFVLKEGKGGFKSSNYICPIALFHIMTKAECGINVGIAECPFRDKREVVIDRDAVKNIFKEKEKLIPVSESKLKNFRKLMEEVDMVTSTPAAEKRALKAVREINTLRDGNKKVTI